MKPSMFSMSRTTVLIISLAGAAALVSGCQHASSTTPLAPSPEVTIDNFSFTPATITVTAGTTVTWINHDDVPHTVTADDRQFASKALDTDDRFSHAFATPGTYSYFCAVHPHMTGKIIVK